MIAWSNFLFDSLLLISQSFHLLFYTISLSLNRQSAAITLNSISVSEACEACEAAIFLTVTICKLFEKMTFERQRLEVVCK